MCNCSSHDDQGEPRLREQASQSIEEAAEQASQARDTLTVAAVRAHERNLRTSIRELRKAHGELSAALLETNRAIATIDQGHGLYDWL